jgi:hypothetical protein
METVCFSETTLVSTYKHTRRHNPEDSNLHTHRRENLKSYQHRLPHRRENLSQFNAVFLIFISKHKFMKQVYVDIYVRDLNR